MERSRTEGYFAYKLGYLMDIAHHLIDFTDYHDLFGKYEKHTKISFDYAVVEKEKRYRFRVSPVSGRTLVPGTPLRKQWKNPLSVKVC